MSFIKNKTVHNIFSSNWAYSENANTLVNMLDSEGLSPISSELSPITDTDDLVGGVFENTNIYKNETTSEALKRMKTSQKGYAKRGKKRYATAKKFSKNKKFGESSKSIRTWEKSLSSTESASCSDPNSPSCTSKGIAYDSQNVGKTFERICADRPILPSVLSDYPNNCDTKTAKAMESIHKKREKHKLKNETACEKLNLNKSCSPYDRDLIKVLEKKGSKRINKEKDKLRNLIQKINIGNIKLDNTDEFEREELWRRAKAVKKLNKMNKELELIGKTKLNSDITNYSKRREFLMDNLIKASLSLRKAIKMECKAYDLKGSTGPKACNKSNLDEEKRQREQLLSNLDNDGAAAPAPAGVGSKYVSIFGNNTNQNSDNFTDEEVINEINNEIRTIDDLLSHLKN